MRTALVACGCLAVLGTLNVALAEAPAPGKADAAAWQEPVGAVAKVYMCIKTKQVDGLIYAGFNDQPSHMDLDNMGKVLFYAPQRQLLGTGWLVDAKRLSPYYVYEIESIFTTKADWCFSTPPW